MTFVRSHGWRARVRDQRWRRAARNWVVADDDELSRSTLVVAPHPDDDVLGCGGTIARKRSLGVDVAVVVLTDGAFANRDIIDRGRACRAPRPRRDRLARRARGRSSSSVVSRVPRWRAAKGRGGRRRPTGPDLRGGSPRRGVRHRSRRWSSRPRGGLSDGAASADLGRLRRRRCRVPGVVVAALALGTAPDQRAGRGSQTRLGG